MTEKEQIERATAEGFIPLYNKEMNASYMIAEYSDAPDVRCVDAQGNKLNLELTLTEDRPGDIQARLGRSNDRGLEALRAHVEKVKAGKADALERVSSLNGNITEVVLTRIQAKMNKRYGLNSALVVRDTSGVDWDWSLVIQDLCNHLKHIPNPFDKGIWILSCSKDRIFHVV